MSKKGLSAVVSTLIIVLLFLVAIGIIWVVVDNILNYEQFKITERVCEKQPNYKYFDILCEDGTSGRYTEEGVLYFLQQQTTKQNCMVNISINYETICHEEEVDEIEIRKGNKTIDVIRTTYYLGGDLEKDKEGFLSKNYICIKTRGRIFKQLLCISNNYIFIDKKDLTTEWLVENAECINPIMSCDISEKKFNNCLEKSEESFISCRRSCIQTDCSKYKLGNYTIEVIG